MEWRKISNEHYSISDYGDLRNDLTSRILKPRIDNKGYHKCDLYNGHGKSKGYLAHRLVALYFLDSAKEWQTQVNHIDGNPLNNHKSNLEWCSPKENSEHAVKIGLTPKGETHHFSKITDAQIREIRTIYQSGLHSQYDIASLYGINQSEVSRYINHKRRGGHCG